MGNLIGHNYVKFFNKTGKKIIETEMKQKCFECNLMVTGDEIVICDKCAGNCFGELTFMSNDQNSPIEL